MKGFRVLILLLALLSLSVTKQNAPVNSSQFDADLTPYEYQKFQDHTQERLNIYKKHFKKYSELYNVPWTLIAAVAYQESKWDENAVSHTGVKGLMQLTSQTAEHLGVDDREDPHQSIRGGAFYLKYLYGLTPKKLSPNKRWAVALAGYNIGWGHIKDARQLAAELKKDPYNWNDMKVILPKLEEVRYYAKLNNGYARGNETVVFVEKVLGYYQLLNSNVKLAKGEKYKPAQ